jgi:hypothetical protein
MGTGGVGKTRLTLRVAAELPAPMRRATRRWEFLTACDWCSSHAWPTLRWCCRRSCEYAKCARGYPIRVGRSCYLATATMLLPPAPRWPSRCSACARGLPVLATSRERLATWQNRVAGPPLAVPRAQDGPDNLCTSTSRFACSTSAQAALRPAPTRACTAGACAGTCQG